MRNLRNRLQAFKDFLEALADEDDVDAARLVKEIEELSAKRLSASEERHETARLLAAGVQLLGARAPQ